MRMVWVACGALALALGVAGIVLPLLPTTPFVLLAAWCFARSSPRLHDWLVTHPRFGPLILNWTEHGAIPPRAKRLALLAIAATFTISLILRLPAYALALQGLALAGVVTFIMTRPDGPRG